MTAFFAFLAMKNPDFSMPNPAKVARLILKRPQCEATVKEMLEKKLVVSNFQTIHHCSVRCRSRARASLRNRHQGHSIMGFEDEVEQSLGRRCHQTDGRSKRTYEPTSSIVPRGTSFHRLVELECSPVRSVLCGCHATVTSLVHRNSVPSTQMRCMITASRRARATIAFFIPRRLAICIAQALSHDHFVERSMLWAAS